MQILVIAEHDNSSLNTSTLTTVTASGKIGGEVHVLVAGHNARAAADSASRIAGVSKVLLADAPQLDHGLAECIEATVMSVIDGYSHVFAPATAYGKNIAPRIAARLDVAQISELTAIVSKETFERPIYAGNAIATVRSTDCIIVGTVRTTAFDAAGPSGESAPVETIIVPADAGRTRVLERIVKKSDRPDLATASVVVSGGRGLGSGENYERVLTPLAERLGAALGASRAAVDAGYASNDFQVGQTGKIVAPDVYVAVGISGAIQHVAGMKDSKTIVAINNDPEAPIFSIADYGLVADLFTAIPELVTALA